MYQRGLATAAWRNDVYVFSLVKNNLLLPYLRIGCWLLRKENREYFFQGNLHWA